MASTHRKGRTARTWEHIIRVDDDPAVAAHALSCARLEDDDARLMTVGDRNFIGTDVDRAVGMARLASGYSEMRKLAGEPVRRS